MRTIHLRSKWSGLRTLAAFGIGGGSALFAHQIHCLNRQFSNLLNYAAIEREKEKANGYIEMPNTMGEVEVTNLVSKLMIAEQTLETLIRGPKSLASTSNPWHLLRLLKSDAHAQDHAQALQTLATTNYNEGLSQQIAQACDIRIAVKLARIPDVNLSLFLQPPLYLAASPETVEEDLHKIVAANAPSEEHKCAAHFLSMARKLTERQKDEEYILGWDVDTGRVNRPENDILIIQLYLQAVLQQSQSFDISKAMVQQGLLSVLRRFVRGYPKETTLSTLCAQIVASLSLHAPLHVSIFQSGWIGLLAEFMRSDNIALKLAAGKALANMDEDDRKEGVYDESCYLLHPLHVTSSTSQSTSASWDVDVIFVHGLLGGVSWTWRQSETLGVNTSNYTCCWPKDWLPADVPGLRILGVDYTTSLSHWKSRCPEERISIVARADEVLVSLKRAGLGQRPLVWVGHSMGGLLVEQLLVNASKSSDPALRKIVEKTEAILMLSVPHGGSPVATLNPPARFLLLPSVEVEELRKGSKVLEKLHTEFKDLLAWHPTAIVSVVETKATPVKPWGLELKFVEPSSGDLCFGETHYIPVDHYEICKPLNRNSFVYQRLVRLLFGVRQGSPPRDLVKPSPRPHHEQTVRKDLIDS